MNISKSSSWVFFLAVFVVFAFLSNSVALVTDWWWFSEVGYSQIFIKSLGTKIVLALATIAFAAFFLLVNFTLAIRSRVPWTATLPPALFGQPVSLDSRLVQKLAIFLSFTAALFFWTGGGGKLAGGVEIPLGNGFWRFRPYLWQGHRLLSVFLPSLSGGFGSY